MVMWGRHRTPHGRMCHVALFNSNNYSTSAALVEVRALLSAILVINTF